MIIRNKLPSVTAKGKASGIVTTTIITAEIAILINLINAAVPDGTVVRKLTKYCMIRTINIRSAAVPPKFAIFTTRSSIIN